MLHLSPALPGATGCKSDQTLREVVFHGDLRDRFGDRFEIVAGSPALALNGLMTMIPGLHQTIAFHPVDVHGVKAKPLA